MSARSDTAIETGPAPSAAGRQGGEIGVEVIKFHLASLPPTPGVYRMIDRSGDVLYVGKAKNLKKRVAAYANPKRQGIRIRRMINQTADMEFVTTHTEAEALLLEANLIKKLMPRYNILLRDDKSFPSILLTSGHAYPRVVKHRGARTDKGEYFGPFASAAAVGQSITTLERAFLLRSCTDSMFDSRTRPCLLYQIKRCCAPCVGRVSEADYDNLVVQARAFLTGDSDRIQRELAAEMDAASERLEFELAAELRDRIRAMTNVQSRHGISVANIAEADVLALHQAGGQTCIQVFFFRSGYNYGNRAYYPSHAADAEPEQVLEAFIGQFYADKAPPKLILVSHDLPERALLIEALSEKAGYRVKVETPKRGEKTELVEHARMNARDALARRLAESASQRRLLEGLAEALDLDRTPARIEVFDNSHVSGTNAVGGMIVAGPEGLMKASYRKFNIRTVTEAGERDGGPRRGDDYAMMREVLTRRYSRVIKEDPERTRDQWPDLVLIDGGGGHLRVAAEVFAELGITDVALAAISKGPDRNAGRERIHLPGRPAFRLDSRDPVLYFLQRLRDEAHRFAIGTHRAKRSRKIETSPLDEIPGVGGARKRALLHHFGSARAVAQAGLGDLEAVEGISGKIAERIYDWFHSER